MMLLLVLMLCAIISSVNSAELNFLPSINVKFSMTCNGPVLHTTGYVKDQCIDDTSAAYGTNSIKYVCSNSSPSKLTYAGSATCASSSPTTTALSTTCTRYLIYTYNS